MTASKSGYFRTSDVEVLPAVNLKVLNAAEIRNYFPSFNKFFINFWSERLFWRIKLKYEVTHLSQRAKAGQTCLTMLLD
jgi:hypothetical protein